MGNKKDDVLKINAIKTDNGYYINQITESYNSSYIQNYFFDGEKPEKTYLDKWYLINSSPKKIEKTVNQLNINYRYELIDKKLSSTFPEVILREEFCYYGEDGEGYKTWIIKDEWRDKQSLYSAKSDKQEPKLESIKFEFNVILEIDNIKEYAGLSYPVKAKYNNLNITDKDVVHQIIDRIVFPEPVLTSKPSKITSKDTYNIVREHVKRNIDNKVAQISSDYDFCFTVQKGIFNNKTSIDKKEETNIKKGNITKKNIVVFEMTSSVDKYKGYTIINGFEGKDHEDLKKNIDNYLKHLMEIINAPIIECAHCNGVGAINIRKIKTNPEKKVGRAELIDI